MAKTTSPKTIILVDDELQNVFWLIEFLEAKGFTVETAETLDEALPIVNREIHRALIIDLNIPASDGLKVRLAAKGGAYPQFPGLLVANEARNQGYRDRQVILYTVHREAAVAEEAKRLNCTYILKGRPQEVKREIESVVNFDPTAVD